MIAKATIEISDDLYASAKASAAEQGITMRQWVEAAFRRHSNQSQEQASFRLKDMSFDGGGLQQGVTWDRLLDFAYDEDFDRLDHSDDVESDK